MSQPLLGGTTHHLDAGHHRLQRVLASPQKLVLQQGGFDDQLLQLARPCLQRVSRRVGHQFRRYCCHGIQRPGWGTGRLRHRSAHRMVSRRVMPNRTRRSGQPHYLCGGDSRVSGPPTQHRQRSDDTVAAIPVPRARTRRPLVCDGTKLATRPPRRRSSPGGSSSHQCKRPWPRSARSAQRTRR